MGVAEGAENHHPSARKLVTADLSLTICTASAGCLTLLMNARVELVSKTQNTYRPTVQPTHTLDRTHLWPSEG